MASQEFIIVHEERILAGDDTGLSELLAGFKHELQLNGGKFPTVNRENKDCWSTCLINLLGLYRKKPSPIAAETIQELERILQLHQVDAAMVGLGILPLI